MKILVVAQDGRRAESLRSRFEPMGHIITACDRLGSAQELLKPGAFGIVFIEDLPSENLKADTIRIRKALNNVPYIIFLTSAGERDDFLELGANAILSNEADIGAFDSKIEDAVRIRNLVKKLGDASEDFPSAGGVIAKSAFNQIFLSSLDLPGRNEKQNFLLSIAVDNYDQISELDGPYGADYAVAGLSKFLVSFKRRSDIIGQTARAEFTLLLQGLGGEDDPVTAAKRFSAGLRSQDKILSSGVVGVKLSESLMSIPGGELLFAEKME